MRCAWVSLWWLFFFYLDWALPCVKRTKRRLKEAERLNEVSPSHLSFLKNPTEAVGKIHSANTEVIIRDVKVEVWSLNKFGEPSVMSHLRVTHNHERGFGICVGMGVPFMTSFIRDVPVVQPSERFPSRHFDVLRSGLSESLSYEMQCSIF